MGKGSGGILRLDRPEGAEGVDLVRGSGMAGAFAPHVHDAYCLGLVTSGVRVLETPEGRAELGPGQAFLLNPGQPHACWPAGRAVDYLVLAVRPEFLAALGRERFGPGAGRPWLRPGPGPDALAGRLRQLAAGPAPGAGPVRELLAQALAACAESRAERPEPAAVRRAREHIASRPQAPLRLADLARVAGVSPFHLQRSFRAARGESPHAFQVRLRLALARRLLDQGRPPALVAQECGLFDQSHLCRLFRRGMGVAPGAYLGPGRGGARS